MNTVLRKRRRSNKKDNGSAFVAKTSGATISNIATPQNKTDQPRPIIARLAERTKAGRIRITTNLIEQAVSDEVQADVNRDDRGTSLITCAESSAGAAENEPSNSSTVNDVDVHKVCLSTDSSY